MGPYPACDLKFGVHLPKLFRVRPFPDLVTELKSGAASYAIDKLILCDSRLEDGHGSIVIDDIGFSEVQYAEW